MRIAFVGHKTLPANYSGVEVYAEEVGALLVERGHEVFSFCSGELPPGGRHRGIQCLQVGKIDGKHMGALSQAFAATLAAARADVDVIHYMAMGPTIFTPIVRLVARRGIVVTVAGRDDRRRKWGRLAKRLMRLSYYTCTRVPDVVVCVSDALRDELRPSVRGLCTSVANGVTVPPASSTDIEAILPNPHRPYVLFAARLVPEKLVDVLIDAFKALDQDIDLVVAGGPAATKDYVDELHAQATGDERILFIGHRSADEVDVLMRRAAVYVLASELEGMPIALLEAAGRGTPVVVSDLPCHREVLGDGGPGARIVPVGDAPALTKAIAEVLQDPLARQDARVRAEQIIATHTWDRVASFLEPLYEHAAARRTRTPIVGTSPPPAARAGR